MDDMTEDQWSKMANDSIEKIRTITDDIDNDMLLEILACLVADLVETLPKEVGIPMMFEFMSDVLQKAYESEFSFDTFGPMQ